MGNYNIPSWVPVQARELLNRMLVIDPDGRSRADEIARDVWLHRDNPEPRNTRQSTFFVAEKYMDAKILQQMQVDADRIHAELCEGMHTGLTTWYRLLHEQYARTQEHTLPPLTPINSLALNSPTPASNLGGQEGIPFGDFLKSRIAQVKRLT